MTMKLPDSPLKLDYEDMVVAALIAQGFYVEGRLVFKQDTEEILEFDALATPITDYKKRYVVEVKSGKWGNGDIFKLAGQVQYTGNEAAWLVYLDAPDNEKAKSVHKISKALGVGCIHLTRASLFDRDAGSCFPSALVRSERAQFITTAAWWSRLADRVALDCFRKWHKSIAGSPPVPDAAVGARKYHDAVENSLFERTPLNRAMALYESYRKTPNVSLTVSDIGGNGSVRMKEAWGTAKHMHIQYLMTLQNRSRLAIIKNAYDQILIGNMPLSKEDGNPAQIPQVASSPLNVEDGGLDRKGVVFYLSDFLPPAFIAGFRKLQAHPHPERVPYFFQTFIEVLGGFYFPGSSADCQLVEDVTTMPRSQIRPTLELLDVFFPFAKGWLVNMAAYDLCFLKAVPAYMRGIGSWFRANAHGTNAPDTNAPASSEWYKAVYEVLSKHREDLSLPAP